MTKCAYAGDKLDSVCVNCNGIEFIENGVKYPSTDCKGFEPLLVNENEVINNTPTQSENILPIRGDKPVANINTKQQPTPNLNVNLEGVQVKQWNSTTKSLRFTSSVTLPVQMEHGTGYYKFTAEQEIEVAQNEQGFVNELSEWLWQRVHDQVDQQVQEIKKNI